MVRRAAGIAVLMAAGLGASITLPAQPAATPPEFVTAIVTLRSDAPDPPPPDPMAATLAPAAADLVRAEHGRALLAHHQDATLRAQGGLRDAVAAMGGSVAYAGRAFNAVVVRIPAGQLEALTARDEVADVEIDLPRRSHLSHVAGAMKLDTFWAAGYTGGVIDVAVIDTGLYVGHEAFDAAAGSVVSGVFHDTAKTYLASIYDDDSADPDDFNGHGTFVSGMVFSHGSAAAPSRLGVSYGIDKLFNLKAAFNTTSGGGSSVLADLMDAVDWSLTQPDPPEIYNYSYGATVSVDDDAYARFWDAIVDGFGKVATISAGNSGPGTGTLNSPGIAHNVISVANVASAGTVARTDDTIASSSSRGPTVAGRKKPDLAAPGSSIDLPAWTGPRTWLSVTGTSFSSPAAAAAAALVMNAGVTDPRAVKALLINSAEDRGTVGWDSAYGWGYIDGQRAYTERSGAVVTSVSAPATAGSVRLFARGTSAMTKATITWNRHVSYSAAGPGATGTLNNLDLSLYAPASNALRSSSSSTIDNVEQVASSTAEPVVLVVRSTGTFTGTSETVALAHSGGFVAVNGPAMSVSHTAPATVAPSATFTVTATASNTGDLQAHGIALSLTLPAGFAFASDVATKSVGSVSVGSSASVSWSVRAPASVQAATGFAVALTGSSYDVAQAATSAGTVAVTAGCTYAVATPSTVAAGGGTTLLPVSTQAGCPWTATSGASWAPITSGSSGTGAGTVTLFVGANDATATRTTSLSVAGLSLTLTQDAAVDTPIDDPGDTPDDPDDPVDTPIDDPEDEPVVTAKSYYLAEGATSSFFTLDVLIANPNAAAVPVEMLFLRGDGGTRSLAFTLAGLARRTVRVNDVAGLSSTAVSTVVTSPSGAPLVVERTMAWDSNGYSGHAGVAVSAPETRWYFAEGAQGFFDTYILLANAASTATTATVTFLREAGQPITRTMTLPATSRTTLWAGEIPELVNRSFAIVVESAAPITSERAMYWSRNGQFWSGGHEAAGSPALSTDWFLAEGATGGFFDSYVLIGNPNSVPAQVTVRYLLASGDVITRTRTLAATSRLTIDIEQDEDVRLHDAAVSTTVTSDVPIVVERAMYWGDSGGWFEGHSSPGTAAAALTWGLAEGRLGTSKLYRTYVLIANPSATTAEVKVTFVRENGAPVVKYFRVAPTSRFNIDVEVDVPELIGARFGAVIDSTNDVPVVVERAIYWNWNGVIWRAGTNTTGAPLR